MKYIYSDGKHQKEAEHGMMESPVIVCDICGQPMHRKPQAIMVNWGGLPPHLEHVRGAGAREFINPNAIAKRRDEYNKNLEIVRKGQS